MGAYFFLILFAVPVADKFTLPAGRNQRMLTFTCPAYFLPPAPFPVFTGVVGEYAVSGILL